jgi:hypothetical protein
LEGQEQRLPGADLARLREELRKAADGSASPTLRIMYQRGHDLAGLVTFELRGDGSFTLTESGGRKAVSSTQQGRLLPGQVADLAATVDRSGLLESGGSTRPLGDDEIPILVSVSADSLAYEAGVWLGDLGDHPAMAALDAAMRSLIDDLHTGNIQTA